MSTVSRSNPPSCPSSLCRLRTNRPAPKSSSRHSTTCDTTRIFPGPSQWPPPIEPRACPLMPETTSTRDARRAGTSPHMTPVRMETTAVNARILASGSRCRTIGVLPDDMKVTRTPVAHRASSRPQTPPRVGENHVLDEQLADEPPAAGAEREAHREFRQSRRRAGEHQVGDIGAGNQEDDPDDGHQDEERLRELVAQARDPGCRRAEPQPFGNELRALAAIGRLGVHGQEHVQAGHDRLRLWWCVFGLHSSDNGEPERSRDRCARRASSRRPA